MKKVTAAIITYNEDKNIGRCIKGLMDCVDEIVVLDSFSTDRTREVCRQYGVRFIQQKWEGYANTKNKLNDLIDSDYIFSIDADEVPDALLKEEIKGIKKEDSNTLYILNRRTNYCGKWIRYCGWYPEYKTRIFPKGSALWEGEYVHEHLSFDPEMKTHNLKGHLEHYSYYSYEEHKSRSKKYAVLSAKQYYNERKMCFLFQPELSALIKFLIIFIFKKGFLDGASGFHIAWITAASNHLKYKELKKLYVSN